MTRADRRSRFVAALRSQRGTGPRPSIQVHIGDLVLSGVPRASARRVGDGLAGELARLFSRGGTPLPLTLADTAPRVDAGTVRVAQGSAPATLGRTVANAVYRAGRP